MPILRASASQSPKEKPLKRPTQARAKVTVQAIFDAFVRIWQRDGWARLTTRAVALEAGIAVGTLYDYFPSKMALHSGYVRHCIEALIHAVDAQAVQPEGLAWRERLHRLVQLACGTSVDQPSWFHPDMLAIEPQVAEPKHQRRAHEELCAMWQRVFDACGDLPQRPTPETVQALHLAVWGGRRYAMLVQLDAAQMQAWAAEMERLCCLAVAAKTP
ncbi:TetR/AcrR family transcriptional regulator [Piscinibacter sp. HJYY11]|uniref:TetR/AcrR family transcriptional regulator n=1 Tax=Piscinibacter sp. HJYY11 TaxID=2801333 RepID=UPI00191C9431|nr:TetR/AcrR family transcriptional regulator [Piscinibacter sp. HJYY11]MBL0727597.1 TetR/AcrR family transcriptional regulator [Piscinibacter sp. HJYY11]